MDSVTVTADDGVELHVTTCGSGPDVVLLSGGPGCVHYLASESLAPDGFRCWFPDPRGVARSGGGPHGMSRAIEDLEAIRQAAAVDAWLVLGHSWGSDLGVRYALDHPDRVRGLVGIAGHGLHDDRQWSAMYEAGKANESAPAIEWVPGVHAALQKSFKAWIHERHLWRALADSPVRMRFIAAGNDIRPDWPLRQLTDLVPGASFQVVHDVAHDWWATEPDLWQEICTTACQQLV